MRGLDYVKAQFRELMKSTEALRTGGEDPALATGDVRRLLLGENSLSSLVEAKSPEAKMAIIPTLRLQTIALPEEIDQDFYDHLMAMDGDTAARRAFLGPIAPRISPAALRRSRAASTRPSPTPRRSRRRGRSTERTSGKTRRTSPP